MSAQATGPATIHCRLCSWRTSDPDPVAREGAWSAHYVGVHPRPLRTKCMVPPYCGWTATADDLPTLRRLRDEHAATHTTKPTKSNLRRKSPR